MAATQDFELPHIYSHNGYSIRYLIRCRDGEPGAEPSRDWVVLVHGTPWSSDVFRPVADALYATGRFNIVLYDLPGYGQSQAFDTEHPSEPDTSVKAQGEALAALLRHLKLDVSDASRKPHVIAHDIAGVISLRAHLLHGSEYQSLCLLDTNCVLPWGDKLYNLVRDNPKVFEELPAGVFEGCLRAIIQSARAPGHGLSSEWVNILARPWLGDAAFDSTPEHTPQVSFVRQIKQSDDAHTAELLDNDLYTHIRCDVKILWGEKDAWIPLEKMKKLANMLGSRLKGFVAIPNAGHLIMLDQPERVSMEISRWLELHV